jgi:phage shock protein A
MGGQRAHRLRQAVDQQVRATFQDLFGEGANGSGSTSSAWAEEAQALLAEAEPRLAELRQAGAAALAHAHQAEQAWQTANWDFEGLDLSVDEALRAGQERLARDKQRELNLRRRQLEALNDLRRSTAALAAELAQASHRLAAQITTTREQVAHGRQPRPDLRQTLARLAEAAGERKDRLA